MNHVGFVVLHCDFSSGRAELTALCRAVPNKSLETDPKVTRAGSSSSADQWLSRVWGPQPHATRGSRADPRSARYTMNEGQKLCRVYHLRRRTRLRNVLSKLFTFFWHGRGFVSANSDGPSSGKPNSLTGRPKSARSVRKRCTAISGGLRKPFSLDVPGCPWSSWEDLVVPAEAAVRERGMLRALG